jgi:hypothetical protein
MYFYVQVTSFYAQEMKSQRYVQKMKNTIVKQSTAITTKTCSPRQGISVNLRRIVFRGCETSK